MKRMVMSFLAALFLMAIAFPSFAAEPERKSAASGEKRDKATFIKEEKQDQPELAAAIRALKDAVQYLEGAPQDFGGHKHKAIEASKEAIVQLRRALEYRAVKEEKQERREERKEEKKGSRK